MKKDVILTIKGAIENVDIEDADDVELITSGNYYEKNGKKYIIYEESEVTGFGEGIKTMLKIDGDKVTMTRGGERGTIMEFEAGKTHLGHYETPFGSFTVSTITDRLRVALKETSGEIDIDYFVDVNNVPQSKNSLSVKIREA